MIEGRAQVHLGAEQGQGAVVDLEFAHAARPPLFGSKGAGVVRAFDLGLLGKKAQPRSRANCRTSKTRFRSATAGWTCRDAVVCMVLPRSVVKSESNINQRFTKINNDRFIFFAGNPFSSGRWDNVYFAHAHGWQVSIHH